MRIAFPLLALFLVGCGPEPSSSTPAEIARPPAPQPEPELTPASPSASWLLWPTSADQVEVLGTWVDGHWVNGRDRAPAPGGSHPLVALSGDSSGSLTGTARTVCDQLLLQYQGRFVGDEVMLLSPTAARPRPVRTVDATASDRSLAGQLWPGQIDLDPERVLVADLEGDGTAERIVVLSDADDDGVPLRAALVIVAADTAPALTGWPLSTQRQDLVDAGVPQSAHRVELKGVADVNADGALEVVAIHHLDDLHYHGLVIYSFVGGKLKPIGDFSWGERDCYPPGAWSET